MSPPVRKEFAHEPADPPNELEAVADREPEVADDEVEPLALDERQRESGRVGRRHDEAVKTEPHLEEIALVGGVVTFVAAP